MFFAGSLISIFVCWVAGKYKDKKVVNVKDAFSNRHPWLNMVIGLTLVIIIGTICFVCWDDLQNPNNGIDINKTLQNK